MKQAGHCPHNWRRFALPALLLILAASPLLVPLFAHLQSGRSNTSVETGSLITLDPSIQAGHVNPLIWGIGAPDREIWRGDDPLVVQRLQAAHIKLIRIGAIQYSNYHLGGNTCTAPTRCTFSDMDRMLHAIFVAGAEPLFTVAGYPGGFTPHDWASYAIFMQQVVNRYNRELVLGDKVHYWEMWNEPQIEADGTIPTMQEYADFIRVVGGAMKAVDPGIELVAPAAPFPDLGRNGWVSYVAKQTLGLVDVLSWHDYGRYNATDQVRLEQEQQRYANNVTRVETGTAFVSPSGKHYGVAITEYNMAGRPLLNGDNRKFHGIYNAVYIANAIILATRAKAHFCTFYLLAQSGPNWLGVLDYRNHWSPYTPYYTFLLFGNHSGTTLISGSGGIGTLAYLASRSQDGHMLYIVAVNSNLTAAQQVTLQIKGFAHGTYMTSLLDRHGYAAAGTTGSYTGGRITSLLPALSITAFDISLTQGSSKIFVPT
jgi:hypothetical protein